MPGGDRRAAGRLTAGQTTSLEWGRALGATSHAPQSYETGSPRRS